MNVILAVRYEYSKYLYHYFYGGHFMRHFYFRLILGIVWLIAAVVSAMGANIPFATLYIILGIRFLWSAHSVWKKEKKNGDNRR